MSHYQHLTISERESIWENKLAGKKHEGNRQTDRTVCVHHQPGAEKEWNEARIPAL